MASECNGDADDADDMVLIQKPFQIVSLPVLRLRPNGPTGLECEELLRFQGQYLSLQFAELVTRMRDSYNFERCH